MTIIHFITNHWLALSLGIGGGVAFVMTMPLSGVLARKYWMQLVLVGGLFVAYEMGFHTANVACQFANASEIAAQKAASEAEISRIQKQADASDKELRIALAAPRAAPVVREVIRANPSTCVVAKPVADSLRESIRKANAAAVSG
jgi:hypothetical protein